MTEREPLPSSEIVGRMPGPRPALRKTDDLPQEWVDRWLTNSGRESLVGYTAAELSKHLDLDDWRRLRAARRQWENRQKEAVGKSDGLFDTGSRILDGLKSTIRDLEQRNSDLSNLIATQQLKIERLADREVIDASYIESLEERLIELEPQGDEGDVVADE